MGIHLAQEAEPDSTNQQVWFATATTFLSKFLVASTFALPLIFLPLNLGMLVCLCWGALILILLSYYLAREQGSPPWPVITEHLLIAILVVLLSYGVGVWVKATFS